MSKDLEFNKILFSYHTIHLVNSHMLHFTEDFYGPVTNSVIHVLFHFTIYTTAGCYQTAQIRNTMDVRHTNQYDDLNTDTVLQYLNNWYVNFLNLERNFEFSHHLHCHVTKDTWFQFVVEYANN